VKPDSTPARPWRLNIAVEMALPPQHRTPRIDRLNAIVAAVPPERLMDFPA
jgi:hypothetical protein